MLIPPGMHTLAVLVLLASPPGSTMDGTCRRSPVEAAISSAREWIERARAWVDEHTCDASEHTWANPVLAESCPDPHVLADGGLYYMVCTGGDRGGAFRVRTSTDLVRWETTDEYLFDAGVPRVWARKDFWAPEIHAVGDGYVAYYTARGDDGKLAIGAMTSDSPLGPWTEIDAPLVHDPGMGMIDASTFVDADGTRYLTWKADGNALGKPTPIFVQELAPDGVTLVGARTEVLRNTLGWEDNLVEGPYVVHRDGWYYLVYSANAYYDGRYATGVARSRSPLGPWEKKGEPILSTGGDFAGPGHGSVVQGPDGRDWFVYHAYAKDDFEGGRMVLIDPIDWENGWPSIGNGHPSNGGCDRP